MLLSIDISSQNIFFEFAKSPLEVTEKNRLQGKNLNRNHKKLRKKFRKYFSNFFPHAGTLEEKT